ncbi:hypothetical protein O151_gp002 [Staphylococcus phage vB_SauM_Remus]|uniref:Dmd n=5 Tax=Silviavirus remus TaxID=1857890 RepID=S4T9F0_9CAUD|nr:hypothetical protein QLX36_gp156 [Staphylococcus phage vB_SauM_Romulus]YP_008431307.1 hypothetical protein O151_gp002 [Staphylococcus phage vB_SauM_Remus]QVD57675.1 hypothetical protein PM56_130 [Staphylococcus phage PM56]QVD58568.1 hypothetical protein PM93_141 [Staphylococcus phage PM93]QVD58771.1 hypothetical protein Remus_140 [Silviavirus remus]QVD58962.1 hypothetical protein Romulus_130 [Staphylococcus phage Romulus]BEU75223.1 hypothetical protein RNIID_0110 [Staphylococcus phage phiR
MKTKKDIKEQRKELKDNATAVSLTKKGDKRIASPSRVCCLCGQSLSGMNYTKGKSIAKVNHFHLQYSKYLYFDICADINNCYKNLKKVGELIE